MAALCKFIAISSTFHLVEGNPDTAGDADYEGPVHTRF